MTRLFGPGIFVLDVVVCRCVVRGSAGGLMLVQRVVTPSSRRDVPISEARQGRSPSCGTSSAAPWFADIVDVVCWRSGVGRTLV